jgi:hypothetical protein
VTVLVDLPAARPGRLAQALAATGLGAATGDFQTFLRGARTEPLPDGIRLRVQLDLRTIARLADLVRVEADGLAFWSFRVLADPPECWLEVTGAGDAGALARTVFGALGA